MDARGRSGGLVSTWDPRVFSRISVIKNESFLLVSGRIAGTDINMNIVNIYAPCDVMNRRNLWGELKRIREQLEGFWIIIEDFNEVREEGDRMNSRFDSHSAMLFNTCIAEAGLLEYQMGRYKYTYMSDDGSSLSKIDRILVCEEFINKWPTAKFEALARNLSDHSPLTLICSSPDFGPIPFKFYNSWLEIQGIEEMVFKVLGEHETGVNSLKEMAGILKKLKIDIKQWRKENKLKEEKELYEEMKVVEDIEKTTET